MGQLSGHSQGCQSPSLGWLLQVQQVAKNKDKSRKLPGWVRDCEETLGWVRTWLPPSTPCPQAWVWPVYPGSTSAGAFMAATLCDTFRGCQSWTAREIPHYGNPGVTLGGNEMTSASSATMTPLATSQTGVWGVSALKNSLCQPPRPSSAPSSTGRAYVLVWDLRHLMWFPKH